MRKGWDKDMEQEKLYVIEEKTYEAHIDEEVHLYGLLHQLAFLAGKIKDRRDMENLIDTDALEMMEGAGAEVAGVIAITKVAALAYLMFNLYTPPCFAAIGAMNSEMKSGKWLWAGIGLQLGTGYTVGYLVYQIGTLITTGSLGAGFAPGLIAVVVFAAILVYLCMRTQKDLKSEYALSGAKS